MSNEFFTNFFTYKNARLCKKSLDKRMSYVYIYITIKMKRIYLNSSIFLGNFFTVHFSYNFIIYHICFFQDRSQLANSLMWLVESVHDLCGF